MANSVKEIIEKGKQHGHFMPSDAVTNADKGSLLLRITVVAASHCKPEVIWFATFTTEGQVMKKHLPSAKQITATILPSIVLSIFSCDRSKVTRIAFAIRFQEANKFIHSQFSQRERGVS